jgi:hypothetical protein
MKLRKGFVSNSSSSSFIVATTKEKEKLPIKITLRTDLNKYVNERITTIEELIFKYKDDMCYSKEEMEKDEGYIKSKEAIEKGKIVLMGSFDDQSDDDVESAICKLGLENTEVDDCEIIEGEGGY